MTPIDRAKWGVIDVARGLAILLADVAAAQAAVDSMVRVRLGVIPSHARARFDCLVSLAFNIGTGALAESHLLREVNRRGAPRSWRACGPLWLEWDHVNGRVSQGLLNRRREEFRIFAPGRYPR